MQVMDELRKRQMAIAGDFKSRAQKAEKILGEIEECEKTISALSESLSDVLWIGVMTAAVAAKVPRAKAAKVKIALKRNAAPSQRDCVRDFMAKAGKPMKIAEIVLAMQKAGHVFQAKSPVAAMSLLMYNNKKVFKRVKPGTFAVVAAKVPQVKAAKVKLLVKPNTGPTLRDCVRKFMLKAGIPMKIADIVLAMQKAGHVFQARKPVKTMTKLMYNNNKVFKRVKPGTFKAV